VRGYIKKGRGRLWEIVWAILYPLFHLQTVFAVLFEEDDGKG